MDLCGECGAKVGTPRSYPVGVWMATCYVCGEFKFCCAPRDFGWPSSESIEVLRKEIQIRAVTRVVKEVPLQPE